jgi:hypothetical protein
MAVIRKIPVGDLALRNHSPYWIDGPDYTRQKLSARFKFFKAEWFMNRLEGVPYYEQVFVHNPDLDVVSSLFKRIIVTCPGVISLGRYAMVLDPVKRRGGFAFKAKCDGGEFEVKPEDQDFILDLGQ